MTKNKRAPTLVILALGIFCARAAIAAPAQPSGALDSYLSALTLENKGDNAGALKAYQVALAADPDSVYLLLAAGGLALDAGDAVQAGDWARKAVAVDSSSARAYSLLGRVAWAQGNMDEASSAFEQALRINPSSTDAAFSKAEIEAADSPDKALEFLSRFLSGNPGLESQVRYETAKIEVMAGRLSAAASDLESVAALDPEMDTLEGRYALAQAYEIKADTPAALTQYQEVLSEAGPSALLLDHVADLSLDTGDARKARKDFKAAHDLTPSDPEADDYLAAIAERRGDFSQAAAFIDSSAALGQDPALSLRLSYDLTQANETAAAVGALAAAHARWPGNDEISYFLALGYRDLGEINQAESLLRGALKARPDFRDARYRLAEMLEAQNKMAQAEKQFDTLLTYDPDDAPALNYLGYSLADRGLELPRAEALARKAVALDPNNGAYQDSLGWAYFKENSSSEAVSALQRAVSLIPDDETIWLHLGDAYAAAGNWPASWTALMRSASLSEGGATARRARPARKHLDATRLGPFYLKYLGVAQGGIARVSGLCLVKGSILGRDFSFNGLLSFQAPDSLDLEWMGPLFTPILIMRLTPQGLSLTPDSFDLNGLSPEAVKTAAGAALALLQGYLSGAVYTQAGARYDGSWFYPRVRGPEWTLDLGRGKLFAARVRSPLYPGVALSLGKFSFTDGRAMPGEFLLSGRGFSIDIVLEQAHVQFLKLSSADLAP